LDESYFGGVRKGKRGRGAAGKVLVFGILKRGEKVYARIVADTKKEANAYHTTKNMPWRALYTLST